MGNVRERRKQLAKLIEAEFETIQFELENIPNLIRCDYKTLKGLNVDSLIAIRKDLQRISRTVNDLKFRVEKIDKSTININDCVKIPEENLVLYCSNSVEKELELFQKLDI